MRSSRFVFSVWLATIILAVAASAALLSWNVFLGGAGRDSGNAVAVDGSGNVYIAGSSSASWGSPVHAFSGGDDAFVAKLNASGALQWVTFLGGSGADGAAGIAVDGSGNVYVAGASDAGWGSPLRAYGVAYGNDDSFTAKLNASGVLQWHTFLGFGQSNRPTALAMDGSGNIVIAGECSFGGTLVDAYAAKLNASGIFIWLTFLGGPAVDSATGVDADTAGNVFVAGTSEASWGTPLRAFGAAPDAFAAKLNANGTAQWNTFLGGSGGDDGAGISIDDSGNVYVAGTSGASWGSPILAKSGLADGFAAKLNSSGTLQWNTFLGGGGNDAAAGIAVDGSGSTHIAGTSGASWGNPFTPFAWTRDVFAAKLNTNGALQWSTFFDSGGRDDSAAGISIDGSGNSYLAGTRWNASIPETAFAVKLLPNGIAVTSPNGGEAWTGGTVHDIAWKTAGAVSKVKIEYSSNGGSGWTTIVVSTSNTGSYAWTVPSLTSVNCLVRVKESTTGTPSDTSDGVFSISLMKPAIALSRTAVSFGASPGGTATPNQQVVITNADGGTLSWKATPTASWITTSPANGTGGATVAIGVNPAGLAAGTYSGYVAFADPNASNSPQNVAVNLHVYAPGGTQPPFGEFATPVNGAAGITGAIPVTGWALDDIAVDKVAIWRDPVLSAGEAGSFRFVGDAAFVEGARPDIETAYPAFPLRYRAGWGYMLLTNFLPNQGNGTYKLYAVATDREGNQVMLGARSITCDNAHAVKPFGTIDTPAQGGNVSGNPFLNFGWVLTPMPKTVPKNGSTISVYVDSVLKGTLATAPSVYNQYRSDVAGNFPGLNNTGGPVGAYFLDTTAYANGVHTIHWVAADDAGAADGIGSRYFNIVNTGGSPGAAPDREAQTDAELQHRPISLVPIRVKVGFDLGTEFRPMMPNEHGMVCIEIPEVNRVEIDLADELTSRAFKATSATRFSGYLVVGSELRPLPVGSTLDPRTGRFSWMPGPGFLGTYELIFVRRIGADPATKVPVRLTITPKR